MYFITICTHDRLPLFGEVIDGKMMRNETGMMAEKCWCAIPDHFPWAMLDVFIVMPNHVHGIITIGANVVGTNVGAKNLLPLQLKSKHGTSRTIGSIIRGFKIGVTKWFRSNTDVHAVWQRNYYEHIIRNDEAYLKIAEYIQTNPQRWEEDIYHI
ncbi:MAG: hypothetical protein NTV37_05015 [Proteobacteria bacterium]|nr:hypothetical protein [Pseudomonadota bacterium]